MINEKGLAEVNGLVARFYAKPRKPYKELMDIQLRLLVLGLKLDHPIAAPDPHAPEGGSSIAMRKAA